MHTINIVQVDDLMHVRVTRWAPTGRYGATLLDVDVLAGTRESELGMLVRCLGVARDCLERRRREIQFDPWDQPELPVRR